MPPPQWTGTCWLSSSCCLRHCTPVQHRVRNTAAAVGCHAATPLAAAASTAFAHPPLDIPLSSINAPAAHCCSSCCQHICRCKSTAGALLHRWLHRRYLCSRCYCCRGGGGSGGGASHQGPSGAIRLLGWVAPSALWNRDVPPGCCCQSEGQQAAGSAEW